MLSRDDFSLRHLRGDIFGALTSTVVALPFALAFGVASGAGAAAGIYCAIITGFFASLFGGCKTQVSGPNTGLTVAMAAIISQFVATDPEHGLALAFSVVVLAGVMQLVFGLCRLGRYFVQVPYPVISGFTSGIGILIILSQWQPLLALGDEFSLTSLPEFWWAGLLALVALYAWPARLNRYLPAGFAVLLLFSVTLLITDHPLPMIDSVDIGLPQWHWPQWSQALWAAMLKSAFLLAVLSSLDSLLTALLADNQSQTHHDADQELVGQGIGNMLAGLFGALPGGGAGMRTLTNYQAGGRTPLSGMLHAIFILVVVLWLGQLTSYIPVAVLAAILIKVGIGMIDWHFLRRLHCFPMFSSALMLLVMALSVFMDLVSAVLIGVFFANLVTLRRLSDIQLDNISIQETELSNTLLMSIKGPVSYGVARGLKQRIAEVQHQGGVIIDFSQAHLIGISCLLALEDVVALMQREQRPVFFCGVHTQVMNELNRLGLMDVLPKEHIQPDLQSALQVVAAVK